MDGFSIAASLAEITPAVIEGTLRTLYQPAKSMFAFRIFASQELQLLIDLSEASIRLSNQDIENPVKPSTFVMFLRKHLRGSRILRITQDGWDRVVTVEAVRREGAERFSYQLMIELTGTRGNLLLFKDDLLMMALRSDRRNAVGRPYVALPNQGKCDPAEASPQVLERWLKNDASSDTLARKIDGLGRQTAADLVAEAAGDDLALELSLRLKSLMTYIKNPQPFVNTSRTRATFYPLPAPAEAMPSFQEALDGVVPREREESLPAQDSLLRGLKRAILARDKTISKLLDWLDDSSQADAWQAQADLLMTYHRDIPRGQRKVLLKSVEDGQLVEIPLDPSLSAIENAQAIYKRAKRIRRGHPHVHLRLRKLRSERALLQSALEAYQRDAAVPAEALALLPARKQKATSEKKAVPFRQFEVSGFQIWVGKSARQNDALLRAASPNDLWMHANDYAGSHVVIRSRGQQRIPDEVIQAAARLAVLHSKAKSERRAEVTMTQVKHVRKPKGAPAGLVTVQDTVTLTVNMEEGRE